MCKDLQDFKRWQNDMVNNTEHYHSTSEENGLYHRVRPMEGNVFIQDTNQTTWRLHKENSEYISGVLYKHTREGQRNTLT